MFWISCTNNAYLFFSLNLIKLGNKFHIWESKRPFFLSQVPFALGMHGKLSFISPVLQFTFIPTEKTIFLFIFQVTSHGLKTSHNEKSSKKKKIRRVTVNVNEKITIFSVLLVLKWEDGLLWADLSSSHTLWNVLCLQHGRRTPSCSFHSTNVRITTSRKVFSEIQSQEKVHQTLTQYVWQNKLY